MAYSEGVKPVALPPGRDRLSTIPAPTGSGTNTKMIGTGAGDVLQGCCCFRANGQNYIWRQRDQLRCVFASALGVSQGRASVDLQVLSNTPPQVLQSLLECLHPRSRLRVGLREVGEHAHTAHSLALLRARRERPYHRRTAEYRNEVAPLHLRGHSITSSARASTVAGMSSPSALAVLRLITSSYLVGACTGR